MKAPVACCDENVSTWVRPQSLVNSVIAWCVICFWVWHHLVCTDLQCCESLGFVAPCVMPLMNEGTWIAIMEHLCYHHAMQCRTTQSDLVSKGSDDDSIATWLCSSMTRSICHQTQNFFQVLRWTEGIIKGHTNTTSACVVKVFLLNNESLKTMTQGTQKENSWIKCTREGLRGSVLVQFSVA